eukprot:4113580-Amphidinium_carterae.3
MCQTNRPCSKLDRGKRNNNKRSKWLFPKSEPFRRFVHGQSVSLSAFAPFLGAIAAEHSRVGSACLVSVLQ